MLVRCLYASRAIAPLSPERVDAIVEQSHRNNPRRGITGLLCFVDDIFIQVLEGGRDAVCDLFNTIAQDDRHHRVRILSFGEIAERNFGNWTMGRVNIATVNTALLLRYSEKPVLDPFSAPASATMAVLDELVAIGSIVSRPV
jgi:hypothetical protein